MSEMNVGSSENFANYLLNNEEYLLDTQYGQEHESPREDGLFNNGYLDGEEVTCYFIKIINGAGGTDVDSVWKSWSDKNGEYADGIDKDDFLAFVDNYKDLYDKVATEYQAQNTANVGGCMGYSSTPEEQAEDAEAQDAVDDGGCMGCPAPEGEAKVVPDYTTYSMPDYLIQNEQYLNGEVDDEVTNDEISNFVNKIVGYTDGDNSIENVYDAWKHKQEDVGSSVPSFEAFKSFLDDEGYLSKYIDENGNEVIVINTNDAEIKDE